MKQSNGSAPLSVGGDPADPARTALVEVAQQAAARCASAALVASRCAAECGVDTAIAEGRECIERCVDASRTLSAAAEILVRPAEGDRLSLMVALGRAALVAAQQCAAACAEFEDVHEVCADCLIACRQADSSLRTMLDDLAPLIDEPDERRRST